MKPLLLNITKTAQPNTSQFHIKHVAALRWIATRNFRCDLIQTSFSLLFLFLLLHCAPVQSHGGVFLEDDLCLIQIGFFKAHFTIYQPQQNQHIGFCEDIPDANESVFVMEYMHEGLKQAPVEFRIIKDILGRGRFFQEEDLDKIDDINAVSVFYQSPQVHQEGVLLALHKFTEQGNYIGIVTAKIPNIDEKYIAVFPFRVGSRNWGYIPLFIALIIFIQLNYWLLNGGYSRLRRLFN